MEFRLSALFLYINNEFLIIIGYNIGNDVMYDSQKCALRCRDTISMLSSDIEF